MKTLAAFAIVISLFLASCSTTYDASAPYDEVYAVPGSSKVVATERVTVTTQPVETTTEYEGDYYSPEYRSATAENEEEFNPDEYYDYEYSSRIKRFHEPNVGFDYYNNYYTDVYYYTGNPAYYGTSIYSGYGCGPSLYLGLGYSWGWGSIGYGWGYPYRWYNPYWYDPFYSWGYYPGYYWGYYPGFYPPYYGGSYWSGYWHGYNDGYWAGSGGYYPGYDHSNYYYGPRSNRGGSSNGSNALGSTSRTSRDEYGTGDVLSQSARGSRSTATNAPGSDGSLKSGQVSVGGDDAAVSARGFRADPSAAGQAPVSSEARLKDPDAQVSTSARETRTTSNDGVSAVSRSAGTQEVPAGQSTSRDARMVYDKPVTGVSRDAGVPNTRSAGETTYSPSRRVQPEAKYEKPKTYTSPTYRTTPSRQEYSSPSTRESRNVAGEQQSAPRRVYTQTPERKSYDQGSRGGEAVRSLSTPSTTTRQSYSSPSRQSRSSYSAPSAPRQSYSAPSRSVAPSGGSSGGGGMRSSGSSSGGGGGSRGGRK